MILLPALLDQLQVGGIELRPCKEVAKTAAAPRVFETTQIQEFVDQSKFPQNHRRSRLPDRFAVLGR